MVYAAVDLKETEDYHGETVKTAAIALLVIAGFVDCAMCNACVEMDGKR